MPFQLVSNVNTNAVGSSFTKPIAFFLVACLANFTIADNANAQRRGRGGVSVGIQIGGVSSFGVTPYRVGPRYGAVPYGAVPYGRRRGPSLSYHPYYPPGYIASRYYPPTYLGLSTSIRTTYRSLPSPYRSRYTGSLYATSPNYRPYGSAARLRYTPTTSLFVDRTVDGPIIPMSDLDDDDRYDPYQVYDPVRGGGQLAGYGTTAVPALRDTAETALRLRQSAARLRRAIGLRDDADVWMRYLDPDQIIDMVDQRRMDVEALKALSQNYLGTAGNPELTDIWSMSGFRETEQGLNRWIAEVERSQTSDNQAGTVTQDEAPAASLVSPLPPTEAPIPSAVAPIGQGDAPEPTQGDESPSYDSSPSSPAVDPAVNPAVNPAANPAANPTTGAAEAEQLPNPTKKSPEIIPL